MPAVSRPLVDPNTADAKGQYAILAHELAQKLLKGAGTQHARIRAFQTTLEELAMQNYQEGLEQGHRQIRVNHKEALGEVHAQLKGLREGAKQDSGNVDGLDEVMASLALVVAQCEEAAHVEEALKEATPDAPPVEDPPPVPPAGLYVYKASIGANNHFEISPKPMTTFSLDNCVVWIDGKWVGWAGSHASPPCWVAARIKPKG